MSAMDDGPTSLEIRMLTRKIIHVVNFFDEEREIPWNYVERSGDGRFESFVTVIINDEMACPISLGLFDDYQEALRGLDRHP